MLSLDQKLSSTIQIYKAESRSEMGAQAAKDIATEVRACLDKQPGVRMVFAAAPSQAEMLASLRQEKDVDWSRVTAFHMDEYLDLAADAPQRFGLWLRRHLFDHLPFREVHLMEPGNNPEEATTHYAAKLNAAPIDIVCCGIGSNGHLAFNDPPADFDDPLTVKIVSLDLDCRQQQVDDECFVALTDVPERAITITIPGLFTAHSLFCCVPGLLKKEAVRRTLTEKVNPMCPATILQEHPRCKLYLDPESAPDTL